MPIWRGGLARKLRWRQASSLLLWHNAVFPAGSIALRFLHETTQTDWLHHPFLLPRSLRNWLTNQGSLTRRLKHRCGTFSVQPTRIGIFRAGQDENPFLKIASNRLAYVREVILHCDNHPVVFAHSVVSLKSLRGPWAAVTRLGTRPLGEALFSNPRVIRGRLQYRRIPPRHTLARQAALAGVSDGHKPLWARRSLFTLQGHPIMVTEIFLPAIVRIKNG